MYKACHTEQSSLRQQKIAEVFLHLLQETPMAQLHIADLCREAGVARKVFYRYFDTKEDVLRFLMDTLYAEMQLNLPHVPFRRGTMGLGDCVEVFRFWVGREEVLNLLLDSRYAATLQDALLGRFLEEHPALTARVQQDWRLVGSVSFLLSGLFGLLRFWKDSGYRETPEEMGKLLLELLG